jgi:hypothetical protein
MVVLHQGVTIGVMAKSELQSLDLLFRKSKF